MKTLSENFLNHRTSIPKPQSAIILKKHFQDLIDDILNIIDEWPAQDRHNIEDAVRKETLIQAFINKIKATPRAILTQRAYGRGLMETLCLYGTPDFLQKIIFSAEEGPAVIDTLRLFLQSPIDQPSMTYWAAYNMSSQMLDMMMEIDHGLWVKIHDGITEMHLAAYHGDFNQIRAIAASCPHLLHQADRHDHTPLFYATIKNHEEISQYFQTIKSHGSIKDFLKHNSSFYRASAIRAWRHASLIDCWWGCSNENMKEAAIFYQNAISHLTKIPSKTIMDESLLMHCYGRFTCLQIKLKSFACVEHNNAQFQATIKRLKHMRAMHGESLTAAESFLEEECTHSIEEWQSECDEFNQNDEDHSCFLSATLIESHTSAASACPDEPLHSELSIQLAYEDSAQKETRSPRSYTFFTGVVPLLPIGLSLKTKL